jgi:hypothetical protein
MSSYAPFLRNMCTKLSMAERLACESGSSEGLSFLRIDAAPSPSSARLRLTSAMLINSDSDQSFLEVIVCASRMQETGVRGWPAANDVGEDECRRVRSLCVSE